MYSMKDLVNSSLESRGTKGSKNSSIEPRVERTKEKLRSMLKDDSYDKQGGYTHILLKSFSEAEIYDVADYCTRKANSPGRAFVAIFQKKLNAK